MVSSGKVGYLRMDSFSTPAIIQSIKDFKDISSKPKLVGLIIDLRNSQDFNTLNALKFLSLFVDSNN